MGDGAMSELENVLSGTLPKQHLQLPRLRNIRYSRCQRLLLHGSLCGGYEADVAVHLSQPFWWFAPRWLYRMKWMTRRSFVSRPQTLPITTLRFCKLRCMKKAVLLASLLEPQNLVPDFLCVEGACTQSWLIPRALHHPEPNTDARSRLLCYSHWTCGIEF
jgi:hypothetical protein